ncbi:MAG: RNA polymerase sigma factor [Bacteroidales bacterium]|nr:RNA polymerase sigma factor [Bacteroidales bacterium]
MNRLTDIKEIYRIYSQQLYFTALRITGNSFDAEEVMQDTILKWYSFPQKEGIEKIGSWLKSVCIRKSLDKLREKHRTKEFLQEYKEEAALPPENKNLQYSVEQIRKAILLLPDNYRTIISLHLFEGYDYQEIGEITGTKETTIRSLYKRAKDRLAATIQENKGA